MEPEGERCYEEKRKSEAGYEGGGEGVPSNESDWDKVAQPGVSTKLSPSKSDKSSRPLKN